MKVSSEEVAIIVGAATKEISQVLTPMDVSFMLLVFSPTGDAFSGSNAKDPERIIAAIEKFCAQSKDLIRAEVIKRGPRG